MNPLDKHAGNPNSGKAAKVAVLFEVKPKKEGLQEYLRLAADLKAELANAPGLVRIERFSSLSEEGKLLSVSVWESEQAVEKWRNQMSHRVGQKAGRDSLFEAYRISVARVIREYANDERHQAPRDSNVFWESQ